VSRGPTTPRRVRRVLAVALLALSGAVAAQWIDRNGHRLPDSEAMRHEGNFGVQLLLTVDDTAFRAAWSRSSTPPTLPTTHTVVRGQAISAMIVFHGCTAGPGGRCEAAVEFTRVAPDGTRTPAGSGPLWTGAPAQGKLLRSAASMTIDFGTTDTPGAYKVLATASDQVSGKSLQVSAPFTLQ